MRNYNAYKLVSESITKTNKMFTSSLFDILEFDPDLNYFTALWEDKVLDQDLLITILLNRKENLKNAEREIKWIRSNYQKIFSKRLSIEPEKFRLDTLTFNEKDFVITVMIKKVGDVFVMGFDYNGHKELYDDYYEIRFDNAKQVKRKYDV